MSQLRRFRLDARMSVAELVEKSGVSRRTIYRLESGATRNADVLTLAALADALTAALKDVTVQPSDLDPLLNEEEKVA